MRWRCSDCWQVCVTQGTGLDATIQREPTLLSDVDSAAVVAYLRLFSKVFSEAADGDAVGWMRQLEDEEGVTPLWEVFFQIAAYPVPQVGTMTLPLTLI